VSAFCLAEFNTSSDVPSICAKIVGEVGAAVLNLNGINDVLEDRPRTYAALRPSIKSKDVQGMVAQARLVALPHAGNALLKIGKGVALVIVGYPTLEACKLRSKTVKRQQVRHFISRSASDAMIGEGSCAILTDGVDAQAASEVE
jgi:hypothetical protein